MLFPDLEIQINQDWLSSYNIKVLTSHVEIQECHSHTFKEFKWKDRLFSREWSNYILGTQKGDTNLKGRDRENLMKIIASGTFERMSRTFALQRSREKHYSVEAQHVQRPRGRPVIFRLLLNAPAPQRLNNTHLQCVATQHIWKPETPCQTEEADMKYECRVADFQHSLRSIPHDYQFCVLTEPNGPN